MEDTCSYCGKGGRITKGLCAAHYSQHLRGKPLGPTRSSPLPKTETCVFCGIEGRTIQNLCIAHYQQQRAGKELGTVRPRRLNGSPAPDCSFEGCDNPQSAHGLCNPHSRQMRRGQELTPLQKKGVGHITVQGYRLISKMGHPNAYPNGKIPEHRWVMAEYLGRPLLPTEDVHHRNGNRLDNRIENLELWSDRHQPSGQRVVDLLADARRILALYEPVEDKLS